MTIDPMAAVSSATGGAASPTVGADPALSPAAAGADQSAPAVRVADQGGRVDLLDYVAQDRNQPPAIETLQPESKAKYLSNPQALGEQVLQRLESLHQRSLDYRDEMSRATSSAPAPAGGGAETMAGPASGHVAGTAAPARGDNFGYLNLMFDYALETTMISSSSSQFVSGVNTLMRGQ